MYNLVIILLLLSGSVVTMLSIIAFRRRSIPLAFSLFASMLCAAVWNFGFAAEIINLTLEGKVFWSNLQFLGITFLPVAWFAMTLAATGQSRRTMILIPVSMIIPILTNILIWTNPIHHLFRLNPSIITEGVPFPVLNNDYGIFFYTVHAPYGYLLFAISLFLLVRSLKKKTAVYRKQLLILILSVFLPLTVDLLYVLGITPIPSFNFASITFTISGILLAVNILQYQFLDLLPLAYGAAVREMNVGVIVVDAQNRVSYLNPAAEQIAGVSGGDVFGLDCQEVLPALADIGEKVREESIEIVLPQGDREGTFQLQQSRIYDQRNLAVGKVVTLHDVTERVELHKKIEQLSITDPLTGALNRRTLSKRAEEEIQRAYRYRRDLCMILVDVDNFKEINDFHGHQCGDEILKDIVGSILKSIRFSDMVFRYGGDEFIILLIETNPSGALETAERIRNDLLEIEIAGRQGGPEKISISMGVTGLISNDGLDTMLQRADQALYKAKAAGKDRVELV
ncbi:MAG: diguanylate cyclase [Anaerolineales bacterium]|nr:diguanylate cyclase [Anaerolineales bacterium]